MSARELDKPDFMTAEGWQATLDAVSSLERIKSDAREHLRLYRSTQGETGVEHNGAICLLLTTIGRKTGREITTPLAYMEDAGNLVVVGSLAGYDQHPNWWLNLEKNPQAWAQVRDRKMPVVARLATPDERHRLWPLLIKMLPLWEHFQKRTQREFPVVILTPKAAR